MESVALRLAWVKKVVHCGNKNAITFITTPNGSTSHNTSNKNIHFPYPLFQELTVRALEACAVLQFWSTPASTASPTVISMGKVLKRNSESRVARKNWNKLLMSNTASAVLHSYFSLMYYIGINVLYFPVAHQTEVGIQSGHLHLGSQ